jgi:primosomal protein N' (replication factor Y)
VQSAVQGDPSIIGDFERQRRENLGLPPFSAMAVIEGSGAEQFINALQQGDSEVSAVPYRDKFLVRAVDHASLSSACAAVERVPGSKIRIEVDPARL